MLSLLLLLSLLIHLLAPLHQEAPDLIVTLRDVQGRGVAGATIQVREHNGQGVLQEQQTDLSGQARFVGLRETEIRVAVAGQLADGTPLTQPGQDAAGVLLMLGAPPTTLNLRVEPSGQVLPDPVTMIDPERNPIDTFPTAPIADTQLPSTPLPIRLPSAVTDDAAIRTPVPVIPPMPIATPAESETDAAWLRWLLPLGLVVGGMLLLFVRGRRRMP